MPGYAYSTLSVSTTGESGPIVFASVENVGSLRTAAKLPSPSNHWQPEIPILYRNLQLRSATLAIMQGER